MRSETLILPSIQSKTVLLKDGPMTLTVEQSVSSGAAALIWEEFFESRQRGVDWTTHLPWATQGQVLCVSAVTVSGIVATLLVRSLPETSAAMVGYVCVHKDHRGQELSRMLIELTVDVLTESGFSQLVLWTGKPQVYENSGFSIVAQEQSLKLQLKPVRGDVIVQLSPWPKKNNDAEFGLPPYAVAGWIAEAAKNSVIFVDTPTGATLLAKHGTPSSVIEIMATARPGCWSATLAIQDGLADYAKMNNLVVDQSVGPATMIRPLAELTRSPVKIPLIARI